MIEITIEVMQGTISGITEHHIDVMPNMTIVITSIIVVVVTEAMGIMIMAITVIRLPVTGYGITYCRITLLVSVIMIKQVCGRCLKDYFT